MSLKTPCQRSVQAYVPYRRLRLNPIAQRCALQAGIEQAVTCVIAFVKVDDTDDNGGDSGPWLRDVSMVNHAPLRENLSKSCDLGIAL